MIQLILLLAQFHMAHAEFCEDVLSEQQLRIEAASRNIANINTTRTPEGRPFAPRRVICGLGPCSIISEPNFKMVYRPDHPDANKNGYVKLPNIDPIQQQADLKLAKQRYTSIRQGCDE